MGRDDNEIKRILPRHFRIVELTLEGVDQKDIGKQLGISQSSVRMVQNSPVFQGELARRREEREKVADRGHAEDLTRAREKLNSLAEKAVGVHEELMEENQAPQLRQKSADSILKHAFAGEEARPANTHVTLKIESVENLQLALSEVRVPSLEERE